MTIHDEIIKELTRLDPTGKTILDEIVPYPIRRIELEAYRRVENNEGERIKICPDIILTVDKGQPNQYAVELESDITWDFASSLRQVKNYRRNQTIKFIDVIAIIPEEYQEYARLYRNEGISVWIWHALSHWICEVCDTRQEVPLSKPKIIRKCINKKKHENYLHLEMLTDVGIREVIFDSDKLASYLR